MARDLGAQVVTLTDRNVSDALIRFAQQENISHVVFGQSARSRWEILLRGSVINRFLSEVRDVTVQVVPDAQAAAQGLRSATRRRHAKWPDPFILGWSDLGHRLPPRTEGR